MTYYALTGLTNAFVSIILGFFVYLKNRKASVNRSFFSIASTVAIWGCAYFFWQISTTKEAALFWSRALMAGAIFTPITYFHFIIALLNKYKKYKKLLVFGYVLCFVLLLSDLTPLLVKDVSPKLSFLYWPDPGIAFHLFSLTFFGYFLYSWFLLKKAYPQSSLIKQFQIKYVLLGSVIAVLCGLTNFLLWYDIPIPPFLNGLTASFVIFITYAVAKHHLMNVKVIATELLVALVAVVLFVDLLLSESLSAALFKTGLLITFGYLGMSLIKNVLKEIERRKETEKLATSLAMSEHKIKEQLTALERAHERLKELDKMKDEFISITSHELRTPMTAVQGYLWMLEKKGGKLSEKQKKYLGRAQNGSERMIQLINDMLDVSRIEQERVELDIKAVELTPIIEEVIDELQIKAKKKKLKLEFLAGDKPLPQAKADAEKVRRVLRNLLDNAIKFTDKGQVTVEAYKKGRFIQVNIADTGRGISKEDIPRLFKKFGRLESDFVTAAEAGGTGLGLYISRALVERMRGKISVQSEPKKGSTFSFTLPTA